MSLRLAGELAAVGFWVRFRLQSQKLLEVEVEE